MRQAIKWIACGAIIAAAAFVAIGGFVGCSSPTALKQGEGLTFAEAADRAVAERVLNTFTPSGTPVGFKWDDGGTIRDGWVTIYGNGSGWYVAPGQCQYAPPEACAYQAIENAYSDEAWSVAIAGHKDCTLWPKRCFRVGAWYDADGSEGCFLNWCPIIECHTGCPPTGNGD